MAVPDSRSAKRQRSQEARLARARAERRRRTTKVAAVILVLAVAFVGGGVFLNTMDDDSSNDQASGTAAPTTAPGSTFPPTECPPADGSAERRIDFTGTPPMCIDPAKKYTATFETTEGNVVVELDTKRTPQSVNNFVVLSRYKYYDGTEIFRTDKSIDIIQGGSPHTQSNADPGPGYTIQDEDNGFNYSPGDLVLARTSQPNSGGGQFFFGTGPNVSNLNSQGTYVTLGKTVQGLENLQKIISLGDPNDEQGKPTKTVTVNKVTITES